MLEKILFAINYVASGLLQPLVPFPLFDEVRKTEEGANILTRHSETVGKNGGTIKVGSYCEIDIPRNALDDELCITATLYTIQRFQTGNGNVQIAPKLELQPSGSKFNQPLTIRMKTWGGMKCKNKIDVECQSGNQISTDSVSMTGEDNYEFKTRHFSVFCATSDEIILYNQLFYLPQEQQFIAAFSTKKNFDFDEDIPIRHQPKIKAYGVKMAVKFGHTVKVVLHLDGIHIKPEVETLKISEKIFTSNLNFFVLNAPNLEDVHRVLGKYSLQLNEEEMQSVTISVSKDDLSCEYIEGRNCAFTEKVQCENIFMANDNLKVIQSSSTSQFSDISCSKCSKILSNGRHLQDYSCAKSYEQTKQEIGGQRNTSVHSVENPHGYRFELVTVDWMNCRVDDQSYAFHTWFPGYEWKICYCKECNQHVGWKYIADNSEPFYGLITKRFGIKTDGKDGG